MSPQLRILILLLFLLLSKSSFASHIAGFRITYSYVSLDTYQITMDGYFDCAGVTPPFTIDICYSSTSCNISQTATLLQVNCNIMPDFPYLPPVTNTCNGGSGFGMQKCTYTGQITLPSPCPDWIVSYSNYPLPFDFYNHLYISTRIDNLNYPVNSSMNYNTDPTFQFCVGQPAWNDFSSTDIDGDSLSYHLSPFLDDTVICPPDPFSYVPLYPLQSSTPVVMDSLNGSMTFNPNNIQFTSCYVRVDEFRNGILINSSSVEHLISVVGGCIISGFEDLVHNFQLSPNPANDMINIEPVSNEQPVSIEVFDLSGKNYRLSFYKSGEEHFRMDTSPLKPGFYSLRIIAENSTEVLRFVKM